MNKHLKTLCCISLFAIAMGFMESAVVVYLRKLYYPNGFSFPLQPIESSIALVETIREFGTIIMLLGAGILAGRNTSTRFAWFIYAFAIWDLFYYIFLKAILNWPESLFTWDILFLIPVPWVGPVIAPCILSLTMILLSQLIIFYQERNPQIKLSRTQIISLAVGSLICIYGFCYDYLHSVNAQKGIWTIADSSSLFEEIQAYAPVDFCWTIFWAGEGLILATTLAFWITARISLFKKDSIPSKSLTC